MPRDVPLSNGSLLVAFDLEYRIADLYFPYVGKENHASGHPFRFGVWVDGRFSWVGAEWHLARNYAADSMATEVVARSDDLGIVLRCEDAVDFYEDVLLRHVEVVNLHNVAREVRVFFHHDFHISGTEVGDTALYAPETESLLHYKDDRYFLINCAVDGVVGVKSFACGIKESGGYEGTWRDAEDGVLGGNPIAQGSVDSTLGISLHLGPGATDSLDYWMAAGRDFREVSIIDQVVRDKTPAGLLARTRNYWRLWVRKDRRSFAVLPALVEERYKQSLIIIRSQIDDGGGVVAANDSDITNFARDTYSYVWPRDGALVALALMRAGHSDAPEKFLAFCDRVISPRGYLRHKYTPDGFLGSSWQSYVRDGKTVLPIQEDETALVIWALWQFFEQFQRIEQTAPFYRSLVTRPAAFLLDYVDEHSGLPLPSHDLWEERWGVHTFTVAAVIAGLRAAARVAGAFGETENAERYRAGATRMLEALRAVLWHPGEGRFARMATPGPNGYTLDMTVDSSLFGLVEFGVLAADDPQLESTLTQVEQRLWVQTEIGGLARYENDYYWQVEKQDTKRVPGNPWFVSTMWLARWYLLRSNTPQHSARALELIEWAAQRALPSGVMAEQIHPYTGAPLSVSPLTWSQATYVRAVLEYVVKMGVLTACRTCGQPTARAPRLTDTLAAVPEA